MTRFALLTFLFLAACGGGRSSPPVSTPLAINVAPTSQYWHMEPGTWAEYSAQVMHGTYNPANGMIENVTTSGDAWPSNRVTNLAYTTPDGRIGVARVHTQIGVQATTVDPTFLNILFERTTGVLMGEAGNVYVQNIDPPEALLAVNPVAGEVFFVKSSLNGAAPSYETRYQTISVGAVVITTLVEQPNGHATVYQHCFDGELLEIVYGPVAADNTVDGMIAKRIATGTNP